MSRQVHLIVRHVGDERLAQIYAPVEGLCQEMCDRLWQIEGAIPLLRALLEAQLAEDELALFE